MSYEPTNWKSGDTVTSAKLNKMEKGIEDANAGGGGGSNVVVVGIELVNTSDGSTVTADKTFAEIKSAYEGGAILLCDVSADDNVSGAYGYAASFLKYIPPEDGFPEAFSCETSFVDIQGNACSLGVNFEANQTTSHFFNHPIPNP